MATIPFDDRDGFIWFDGELLPWREAKIHILTQGLHYSNCVFEGERSYSGKVFRSEDHTRRLIRSAEILGMKITFGIEELETAKRQTLDANNIVNGYVRPVAWLGSEQMGIPSIAGSPAHVAIACWEWPSYFPPEIREKGISMKTSRWRKPAPDTAPTESKASGLYMINTLARQEAVKEGYTDALMLDFRGNVVEGTGANFFAVKKGALITPKPDCFLNGLTRQTVIKLAKDLGIPFREETILPSDLKNMEEIFVTGTAAEVTAVGKIDDLTFTVGPVTRKLRDAYENLVHGR